ncbi:fructose-bisphosphate aldolase class I [Actinomycetospora endophytica]|uniref:fructose-bisphosphate aldolase n=1 Tax=Actinomycetospora endophytica TaxID=2291215 RepID=A0ABS8P9H5_9PSEU|nr:class I fructose-bisphosphate aldolase [Actinomycetospora endophytica]MCD2194180.1 fructose-bisphosphate aldolase class I [Actinomycetospora endophytica]
MTTTAPGTRASALHTTAAGLVGDGTGILAADESIATMSRRLSDAGVSPTEEHRRAYRELLVTTADLARGISGVILCEETLHQHVTDGRDFPTALAALGLATGVKVDTGTVPLAGAPGETITEGLDGLAERVADCAARAAVFAKWRAVLTIGHGTPGAWAIEANAHALARYARVCQDVGVVPVVEPEVLTAGSHPLEVCAAVTRRVLATLRRALDEAEVDPAGMVLKPNMVTPGSGAAPVGPDAVARATVDALTATMPDDLAGVAFLSGGQSSVDAAANLAAIRALPTPWPVTFSFGRALVTPALAAWAGDPEAVGAAQAALIREVGRNVAA